MEIKITIRLGSMGGMTLEIYIKLGKLGGSMAAQISIRLGNRVGSMKIKITIMLGIMGGSNNRDIHQAC